MGLINGPEMGCLNHLRGPSSDLSRPRLSYVVRTLRCLRKGFGPSQVLLMINARSRHMRFVKTWSQTNMCFGFLTRPDSNQSIY